MAVDGTASPGWRSMDWGTAEGRDGGIRLFTLVF